MKPDEKIINSSNDKSRHNAQRADKKLQIKTVLLSLAWSYSIKLSFAHCEF